MQRAGGVIFDKLCVQGAAPGRMVGIHAMVLTLVNRFLLQKELSLPLRPMVSYHLYMKDLHMGGHIFTNARALVSHTYKRTSDCIKIDNTKVAYNYMI